MGSNTIIHSLLIMEVALLYLYRGFPDNTVKLGGYILTVCFGWRLQLIDWMQAISLNRITPPDLSILLVYEWTMLTYRFAVRHAYTNHKLAVFFSKEFQSLQVINKQSLVCLDDFFIDA